jgi:hypothetical protein
MSHQYSGSDYEPAGATTAMPLPTSPYRVRFSSSEGQVSSRDSVPRRG